MLRLRDLGWTASLETGFQPHRDRGLVPGRVVAEHRESYRVAAEDGERAAAIPGRLRHQAAGREDLPAVGDWVALADRPAEGRATIQRVLPRATALVRKVCGEASSGQVIAANVDTVLVVVGLDGDFNPRRIERAVALVWESGAQPVLVLNKADLCPDREERLAEAAEVALGVPIHVLSALAGDGVRSIEGLLRPASTLAVLGSSGVGKSTLINRLLGEERLAVQDVRASDGRGQHTTTFRQIVRLPGGALLVDTPGMREFGLPGGGEGLEAAFADVEDAARECRFRDCKHASEPGCAVRDAIDPERLAAWRKLEREREYAESRTNERVRLERHRRWKSIARAQRNRPHK